MTEETKWELVRMITMFIAGESFMLGLVNLI
jgi:hypothetical protein